MRTAAIETAWRLLRFQPGYHAVKRLGPALQEARLRGQSARRRLAHPPPVPAASP
jgi:hypothetical protein